MAGMEPAMAAKAIVSPRSVEAPGSEGALDRLHAIALDHVAGAHVLVVLEGHAAFLPGLNLLDLILEALERRKLAFVDDDIVADQADVGAALDLPVRDAAPGDLADLGDVENLQDLRIAEELLAQGRCEQAGENALNVIHEVVDDVVIADLGAGPLGGLAGFLVSTHVEADDRGPGRFGQGDVRFGDAADAGMNDAGLHLLVSNLV